MHTFSSIEVTSSCPKSNNRAPKSAYFLAAQLLFICLSFLANEWILGPSIGVLEETCMFWNWAWLVGGSMPSSWEVGHVNSYIYQFKFARAPSFSKAHGQNHTSCGQLLVGLTGNPNFMQAPIYKYKYLFFIFFLGGGSLFDFKRRHERVNYLVFFSSIIAVNFDSCVPLYPQRQ
jgi:hypothetical protein